MRDSEKKLLEGLAQNLEERVKHEFRALINKYHKKLIMEIQTKECEEIMSKRES